MSDPSVELDLKFLPDWLKESPAPNRYADFEGEPERGRRDDRRGGGFGGGGDRRGPRRDGPKPFGGPRRDGGKFGGGNRGPQGGRGPQRREDGRPQRQPEPPPPRTPGVRVEMLPEPAAGAGIAKQIKNSARACGVFRVAKMFLERPERYRVRITSLDRNVPLHQVGDGPVSFDRAAVERGTFRAYMDRFYTVETTQGEPPKGNYTSVARHRHSGALLGPSNHHGYQVALRKLYEERYSRRMSFPEFQREIDMVSDPAAVEQWKQQVSNVTVYKTKVPEGEEPVVFRSLHEAEEHFRTTHLPSLVKSGDSLEVAGPAAGVMLDRSVAFAVRDLIEHERRVPIGLVNALRPYFHDAGLHLFKWKKKILLASAIRPTRHPAEQTFSEGISAILTIVGEKPGIRRPELAAKLLGDPAAPDHEAKKQALAADLHYLTHVGYVVEFQNGSLELPAGRRETAQAEHHDDGKLDVAAEEAALSDTPAAVERKPDAGYILLPLAIAAGAVI
jgi:hypothetical protein